MARSKGALELSRLTGRTDEIATSLGISANYVSQIKSGRRDPSPPLKAKIQALWPHIREAYWDEPLDTIASAGEILDVVMPPEQDDSPRAMADRLLKYARAEEEAYRRRAATGDPNALKDLHTLTSLITDKLGKLTGYTLTEREVLSSPPFRAITERVFAAIGKLPNAGEVATVIQAALEDLE